MRLLERFSAAIEWDSKHAPKFTNLKQLAEIGIHPPAADALGDEDLPAALGILIDGLAALGVYLSGTDHLTDRKLYGAAPSEASDATETAHAKSKRRPKKAAADATSGAEGDKPSARSKRPRDGGG